MSEKNANPSIYSREWRLNNLYKIVTKDKRVVVFKMNDGQWELRIAEEEQRAKNPEKGLRFIILKARQIGFTTYKAVYNLDRALFYPNQAIVLTAHNRERAQEIFKNIVKFAYDNMPGVVRFGWKAWYKPQAKYDNRNELFFPSINSFIKVMVDARGITPSAAHLTELSSYEKAEDMMTALLPAVPDNSDVTIESTALGIGNYFHDLWKRCEDGNGPFTPFFYPWYKFKDYRRKVEKGEMVFLAPEIRHINSLPIDLEQKKFYAEMYVELGSKVFQEFPSTPEEAFLSSGRPFFHTGVLKALSRSIPFETDNVYPGLRIYRKPEPGKAFENLIFGVDTSEGGQAGDSSVISVRDRELNLVAYYRDKIPPDALCLVIDRLWQLGYRGVLGIESNNTGIATVSKAKEFEWYPWIYSKRTVDERTMKRTRKVGFSTDAKTRPLILSEIEELVRKGLCTEFDNRQIPEMFTFLYNDDNRPEAQSGKHDDTVMADAICLFMRHEPQGVFFQG